MLESPVLASRALLSVTRSALGRPWRDRCGDPARQTAAAAIAQAHGLSDLLSRVLAGRGVGVPGVATHLAPRLRDLLPDPHALVDMEAAASRLARAVTAAECVAVFGDYDVDGAASAALLAGYLRGLGCRVRVHIPDRITEGYGPNAEAIRSLREEGADLLVTVDCGTAGHAPLAEAARLGLDVVVLDHHQAPAELPRAHALVNPNRQDDLSGLGHLCAAGVVFLTLVAVNRLLRARGHFSPERPEPDLLARLDLVALATVADVVPLVGLNRAFVRQGLTVMRARGCRGIAALLDSAGLSGPPEAWHLGYVLGPRINAGGRIGNARLGAELLLSDDPVETTRIAAELERLNGERQAIERDAVAEAEAEVGQRLDEDPACPVVVTASPLWHQGIVGLVAARLKERFGRPAFAFALRPDGTGIGSGRSIPGADLGRAVRLAVEAGLAVKGGGHAMAAGVTIAALDVEAFQAHLIETLAASVGDAREADALECDGLLTAGGARPEFLDALQGAGPFGQGAPEPVFVLPRHRLVEAQPVGTGHVRFKVRSGDGSTLGGIAFRAQGQPLGRALQGAVGGELHLAGSLTRERWRGTERIELRLCDVASPDPRSAAGPGSPG